MNGLYFFALFSLNGGILRADWRVPGVVVAEDKKRSKHSLRAAKRRKAEQVDWVGGFVPFGYRKDPENIHHLIADEKAAGTVGTVLIKNKEKTSFLAVPQGASDTEKGPIQPRIGPFSYSPDTPQIVC